MCRILVHSCNSMRQVSSVGLPRGRTWNRDSGYPICEPLANTPSSLEWVYLPGEGGLGGTSIASVTAHKANHIIEPRELRTEAWRCQWFASDITWQIKWQIWHHNLGCQVEWLSLCASLQTHIFGEDKYCKTQSTKVFISNRTWISSRSKPYLLSTSGKKLKGSLKIWPCHNQVLGYFFRVTGQCYRLKVCVPPKFICWNLSPMWWY